MISQKMKSVYAAFLKSNFQKVCEKFAPVLKFVRNFGKIICQILRALRVFSRKIFTKFSAIYEKIFEFVFAPECVVCGREDFFLCPRCAEKLPANLRKFKIQNLEILPLTFWENVAAQNCVRKIKFRSSRKCAENLRPFLEKILPKISFPKNAIFIPVPLHRARENFRGFNQSEILARLFAEILNCEVSSEILFRTKNTLPQTKIDAQKRAANLKNAFRISSENAKKILLTAEIFLVDDVVSTGATLCECARVLQKFGFKNIRAIVFATGKK